MANTTRRKLPTNSAKPCPHQEKAQIKKSELQIQKETTKHCILYIKPPQGGYSMIMCGPKAYILEVGLETLTGSSFPATLLAS